MVHNKTVRLHIYGYADKSLTIELSQYTEPLEQTKIMNEILRNTFDFMKTILELDPEHIYLYVESEFKQLKDFALRHLGQINQSEPLIIVFTDADLIAHKGMQRKILREVIQQSSFDGIFDDRIPRIDSQMSLPPSMMFDKSRFSLTEGIATKPIELSSNQFVFSITRPASPFSTLSHMVRPKDKLLPPIYFDKKYIKENFNNSKYLVVSSEFKSIRINDKGEMLLADKTILEVERSAIKEMIAKTSVMILKGQTLNKISLPCRMFGKNTSFNKHADLFAGVMFLHKAASATNSIERFKYIITFLTSKFYYLMTPRKPFNSYLGETYQGHYPDGSKLYIEHVNHDLPQDALLLINEEKNFKLYGNIWTNAKIKTNEVDFGLEGVLTLEINCEKTYIEMGRTALCGLIFGERKLVLKESLNFYCPATRLKAFVKFGPHQHNKRNDHFYGGIFEEHRDITINKRKMGQDLFTDKDKKTFDGNSLCKISGSWIKNLCFDDVEYWNKDQPAMKPQIDDDVLPSDWRFKEDLLWMLYGDVKQADSWKTKLEDSFRRDRKMREEHNKKVAKLKKAKKS